MDWNAKELKCEKESCFANFKGYCDCLKEAYPEEVKCPFYKDRAVFKRTKPKKSSQKTQA